MMSQPMLQRAETANISGWDSGTCQRYWLVAIWGIPAQHSSPQMQMSGGQSPYGSFGLVVTTLTMQYGNGY